MDTKNDDRAYNLQDNGLEALIKFEYFTPTGSSIKYDNISRKYGRLRAYEVEASHPMNTTTVRFNTDTLRLE